MYQGRRERTLDVFRVGTVPATWWPSCAGDEGSRGQHPSGCAYFRALFVISSGPRGFPVVLQRSQGPPTTMVPCQQAPCWALAAPRPLSFWSSWDQASGGGVGGAPLCVVLDGQSVPSRVVVSGLPGALFLFFPLEPLHLLSGGAAVGLGGAARGGCPGLGALSWCAEPSSSSLPWRQRWTPGPAPLGADQPPHQVHSRAPPCALLSTPSVGCRSFLPRCLGCPRWPQNSSLWMARYFDPQLQAPALSGGHWDVQEWGVKASYPGVGRKVVRNTDSGPGEE